MQAVADRGTTPAWVAFERVDAVLTKIFSFGFLKGVQRDEIIKEHFKFRSQRSFEKCELDERCSSLVQQLLKELNPSSPAEKCGFDNVETTVDALLLQYRETIRSQIVALDPRPNQVKIQVNGNGFIHVPGGQEEYTDELLKSLYLFLNRRPGLAESLKEELNTYIGRLIYENILENYSSVKMTCLRLDKLKLSATAQFNQFLMTLQQEMLDCLNQSSAKVVIHSIDLYIRLEEEEILDNASLRAKMLSKISDLKLTPNAFDQVNEHVAEQLMSYFNRQTSIVT